jgi:hypothetical protein
MIHYKHRYKFRLPSGAVWLTLISWAGLGALVAFTDPEIFAGYIYLPIWPMVWLSLLSLTWLVTKSGKRGLIYGTAGTAYLGLKYLRIGYWIYGGLLLGLAVTADWYLLVQKTQNTRISRYSQKIGKLEDRKIRLSDFLNL